MPAAVRFYPGRGQSISGNGQDTGGEREAANVLSGVRVGGLAGADRRALPNLGGDENNARCFMSLISSDVHTPSGYADFLVSALGRFPDRTALIDGSISLSYRDLSIQISRVSQALMKLGLKRGDGLAQLSQNCA